MPNTFVISDTHFNHELILTFKDYVGKPVRHFDSVAQMNECMFDNWNSVVTPADTVYHLGDSDADGLNEVVEAQYICLMIVSAKRLTSAVTVPLERWGARGVETQQGSLLLANLPALRGPDQAPRSRRNGSKD